MKTDRRQFFKSIGLLSAGLFVCPEISLKKLQYIDFVPGATYRNAVRGPINVNAIEGYRKLVDWLKTKVPSEYFDVRKIETRTKPLDWDHQLGIAVSYKAPLRPIR